LRALLHDDVFQPADGIDEVLAFLVRVLRLNVLNPLNPLNSLNPLNPLITA
jgi:hypothetical protein